MFDRRRRRRSRISQQRATTGYWLLGESETEPAKVYYYPMLLASRLRRRLNIKRTLRQRFVFAICTPYIANHVFRHLKNIYWLKLFFFTFIQLTNMSGDLRV